MHLLLNLVQISDSTRTQKTLDVCKVTNPYGSTSTNAQTLLREVEQFDLVLVDFFMPAPCYQQAMDGPEVICQVKQQLKNPPLLVLISNFFTQDTLAEATELCPEADAVLSKQSETTELLAQLQQLLARSMLQEERAVR